ncbi:MAG: HD domain-containing protein [Candidatus Taylorbacteria bacterium]|nr:HD domain-containing protein [Candidatus Taylorbacteria bacterium]
MNYYESLVAKLAPLYRPPHVIGGHTEVHVRGVEKLGEKILPRMREVDPAEYRVAAWLHNLDRCLALEAEIASSGGFASHLQWFLQDSPFDGAGRERIIDAVLQHGKKDDDPMNDSPLLTAIRIADKLDRLTPLNIMAGPTGRSDLPSYDADQPFGYQTNKPCHLKFFLWNVEWYGMLPYDWARELVDKNFFRLFLSFLRELGHDIAERHGIENRIEDDIRTALGRHYEKWR